MAQGKAFTKEERLEILESLREFLELGFSRSRACRVIGLNESTLSRWITADEVLGMKVQGWENAMNKLAMQNLRDGLLQEGNSDDPKKETSKWWAERKMKDEMSLRSELTGADGKDLPTPLLAGKSNTTDDSSEE